METKLNRTLDNSTFLIKQFEKALDNFVSLCYYISPPIITENSTMDLEN